MKIAILNNIPTKYRKDLFLGLQKFHLRQGNKFSVYYLSANEKVRNEKISLEQYEHIFPVIVQFRNFLTPTSDFIINYNFINKLLSYDYLIIFGYNYPTYIVIAVIRRILKKKNILYCDTTSIDSKNNLIKIFLKSLILRSLFNKFIVPGIRSNQYINSLKIYDNIFIAPQYSPLRPKSFEIKEKILKDKLKLVYVGRLAREKQILNFVEIFNKVNNQKFELAIVGSGPLQKNIEKFCYDNKSIKYLGYIHDDNKLVKIYKESDILVLPSLSEPWGLVVNEAINHGLALLLSDQVGSHPDLLDGNGLLIHEISEKELKKCLNSFLKNLKVMQEKSFKISLKYKRENQIYGFNKTLGIN